MVDRRWVLDCVFRLSGHFSNSMTPLIILLVLCSMLAITTHQLCVRNTQELIGLKYFEVTAIFFPKLEKLVNVLMSVRATVSEEKVKLHDKDVC